MIRANDDAKTLTVRQAYDLHFPKAGFSPSSLATHQSHLSNWEKFTSDPRLGSVTHAVIKQFCDAVKSAGMTPGTVDCRRRFVLRVLKSAGRIGIAVDRGKAVIDPISRLSARELLEKFYLPASPEMSEAGKRKYHHTLNWWQRFTNNPPITTISTADFIMLREKALAAGLATTTIEDIVGYILAILRYAASIGMIGAVPAAGKRLRRRPVPKHTPSVADLSSLYDAARAAIWPKAKGLPNRRINCRFGPYAVATHAPRWWRAWLAALFFTALRRRDSLSLRWDELRRDKIVRVMRKTGYQIEIPIHPVLRDHLDRLPRADDFIFGATAAGCIGQTNVEFRRLCRVAGVERFGAQAIRRCSARAYERARAGAGSLILGHRFKGADSFYLDPFEVLQAAIPNLEIPSSMRGTNGATVAAESNRSAARASRPTVGSNPNDRNDSKATAPAADLQSFCFSVDVGL